MKKHIDIKHHYVQDCIEEQDFNFEYVPTAHNFMAVLTKGLDHLKHWEFFKMLGVQGKLSGQIYT